MKSLNKKDLIFQYLLQGESIARTGVVVYETISTTIPGDYDGNGVVNAADYVLWRKSPGSYGGAGGYTTWRNNFGKRRPGSGSEHDRRSSGPGARFECVDGYRVGTCVGHGFFTTVDSVRPCSVYCISQMRNRRSCL